MKAIGSNITRTIDTGAKLVCADNSGAKELEVIGVKARQGTSQRRPACGITDKITVHVTKGTQEVKGEVHEAVIVRQRKDFQRANGLRVRFEDNAAVLLTKDSDIPQANRIKGAVAKEVVERYSPVGKIASVVV